MAMAFNAGAGQQNRQRDGQGRCPPTEVQQQPRDDQRIDEKQHRHAELVEELAGRG
jgi:hypothetical protein